MAQYQFSNDWFIRAAKPFWDQLIPQIKPRKILEIGSYEGASVVYLIETIGRLQKLEIHCIDSWKGGVEHEQLDMNDVEKRFKHNIAEALKNSQLEHQVNALKGLSGSELPKLLVDGKTNHFDFVYVDGSHQAPDVLADAILGFRLLKVGGIMAFDDYLWSENLPGGVDPIRCPKPAVDAFTNIYCRKLQILNAPLYQLYVRKTSD